MNDDNENNPRKRAERIEKHECERRDRELSAAVKGAIDLNALGQMLWEVDAKYGWGVCVLREPELHVVVMIGPRPFATFRREGEKVFGTFDGDLGGTAEYASPTAAFDDAVLRRIRERIGSAVV